MFKIKMLIYILILVVISSVLLWYGTRIHVKLYAKKPVAFSQLELRNYGDKIRYYIVYDDRNATYPDLNATSWSDWSDNHTIKLDTTKPQWTIVYVQRHIFLWDFKELYYFYNVQEQMKYFDALFAPSKKVNLAHRNTALFIGDSLTIGYYVRKSEKAFSNVLAHKYLRFQNNLEMIAAANICLADVEEEKLNQKFTQPYDLIVFELGTNNYLKTPLDVFTDQYSRLIDKAKIQNPKAVIVVLGIWQGYNGFQYDFELKKMAQEKNLIFVYLADLYEDFKNHNLKDTQTYWGKSDWFHPSDRGHDSIARRIAQYFKR